MSQHNKLVKLTSDVQIDLFRLRSAGEGIYFYVLAERMGVSDKALRRINSYDYPDLHWAGEKVVNAIKEHARKLQ